MSPKDIEAIFIDDGGVMNDDSRRAPQWRRLVGEYLAPRLGGECAAWEDANMAVLEKQMPMFLEPGFLLDFSNFGTLRAIERSGWREALPEGSVELSASLNGPGLHLPSAV